MNAFAFRSSRILSAFAVIAAAGVLCVSSGCGSKNKAASAQTPPPQTLSEPVRPGESSPSSPSASPTIPVGTTGETYSAGKVESRELPVFVEPAAPPMPRAPVVSSAPVKYSEPASSVSGGSRVHTMSKGETLYAISRTYKVPVKDILAANNFKDPNKLSVGTKVYIP